MKVKRKKPAFLRQEWFRMGNQRKKWLKWRNVRGNQSKLRQHIKGKGFQPHPGYGLAAALRGFHPSGMKEVMVYNMADIKLADPEACVVRIAGGVGNKKRIEMQTEAERLGIRVLNQKRIALKVKTEKKPAEMKPVEKKETQAPKSPAATLTKGHEVVKK